MPEGNRIAYYRVDSTSYQAGVMNRCSKDGALFTIAADQDEAVKGAVKKIRQQEWLRYTGDREIAETVHAMNDTQEAFRLVVQRERRVHNYLAFAVIACFMTCLRAISG